MNAGYGQARCRDCGCMVGSYDMAINGEKHAEGCPGIEREQEGHRMAQNSQPALDGVQNSHPAWMQNAIARTDLIASLRREVQDQTASRDYWQYRYLDNRSWIFALWAVVVIEAMVIVGLVILRFV